MLRAAGSGKGLHLEMVAGARFVEHLNVELR